jgi:hypothetical protein
MATNQYINIYNSQAEQNLLENLIIEFIRFYGMDMVYVPRKINKYDKLYGADDQSSYETPYTIEMYIKSVDGFSGDGSFMSKFDLQIRDQVIFSMARKVFNETIGVYTNQPRPNEGDIIYFPLNKKVFQIKYVNNFEMFFQLGKLQTWEVTCELFEYSNEIFNTGIADIDAIQNEFNTNLYDLSILTENSDYITTELGDLIVLENSSQDDILDNPINDFIQNESNKFIDFTEMDPFSEGTV